MQYQTLFLFIQFYLLELDAMYLSMNKVFSRAYEWLNVTYRPLHRMPDRSSWSYFFLRRTEL